MVQPAVRRELQRPLDPLEALAADGAEGAPAELAARPLRHVGGLIQLAPELEVVDDVVEEEEEEEEEEMEGAVEKDEV